MMKALWLICSMGLLLPLSSIGQSQPDNEWTAFSGTCMLPDGRHLDHAAIHCLPCGTTSRLRAGRFSFPRLSANQEWTFAFHRPVIQLHDLTVADERQLAAHLHGRDTLSFWQRLAADLDHNGQVDTHDLALLHQLVLKGHPDSLVHWHFLPDSTIRKAHCGWPCLNPDTIRFRPTGEMLINQVIVAIKMGDIVHPQPANHHQKAEPAFVLDSRELCTQTHSVRIPLRTRNAEQVAACQFAIRWDTTYLEWQGFEPTATCASTHLSFAERGQSIAFSWQRPFATAADSCHLPDLLGWLVFRLHDRTPDTTLRIQFSDTPLPIEVIAEDGHQLNALFSGGRIEILPPSKRIRVKVLEQRPPSCAGASDGYIKLMVHGSSPIQSWQWNTGAVGSEIAHLPAGSYSVTITDSAGCPFTFGPIVLPDPPPLTIDAQWSPPQCLEPESGHILLRANGGYPSWHVQWSDGVSGMWERTQLGPGRYEATVTDSMGCHVSQQFELVLPAQWRVIALAHLPKGQPQKARFELLHLDGAAQPFDFQWADGIEGASRDSLAVGNYQLQISDAQHCQLSIELDIWKLHNGKLAPRFHLDKQTYQARLLTNALLVLSRPTQARLTIEDRRGQMLHAMELSLQAGTNVLGLMWPRAWKAILAMPSGLTYEWQFE